VSPWVALFAAGLGVAAGPFLRTQAFRSSVPVETPRRTTCPRCDGTVVQGGLTWRDLAGLRSGRCRWCDLLVGPQPGTVEVAAAVSFGTLALTVDEALLLVAYCLVAAVGIVLVVVDIAVHRLPDRLTALLAAATVATLATQALITGAGDRLLEAMAAGLGASLFYFVLSLLTAGGIGLGDAKLAFGLGVAVGWTGWSAVFWATTLGLALTGVVAIALLALRRAGRKDPIAHGPYMVLAALTMVVLTNL
jgi:leader peptidase (prepilin peptidase)/N-methyltransferase